MSDFNDAGIYYCDIVVTGGGPAGSMAAKYAALGGLDVIMIEKKAEIGAPLRCAEGMSKRWLSEIGVELDPTWICTEIMGTKIVSPSGHAIISDERDPDGSGRGYVIDRHLFDKALARQAADAGAKIMMRTACRDVIRDKSGKLIGIKADMMGEPIEIYAKCVVAADGFESQVARWAGIDTSLGMNDFDTCIQYRMTGVDVDREFCEFTVGSAAPGGYVWIFPKGDGIANVGIGIEASKCESGAGPKHHLDRFIANDPRLNKGRILEIVGGGVSTANIAEITADNLVIVGDAARLINPLTGGGIHEACVSGMHAGKVIVECTKKGDFSKGPLAQYDELIEKEVGDRFRRNYLIKSWFSDSSNNVLDEMIETVQNAGIKKMKIDSVIKILKEKMPELVEKMGFSDKKSIRLHD